MPNSKEPHLKDLNLPRTLEGDKKRLAEVDVPIVTTSASFRNELSELSGEKSALDGYDIVFSRAHFSMSVAILQEAYEQGLSSWFIDPLNYVTKKDWKKLKTVAFLGKLVARFSLLRMLKDKTDALTRGSLPITKAITAPLLYATGEDKTPIISVHYETGNVLARTGRTVLQIVTDPHIRPEYLKEAARKNIYFAVFDKKTRDSFFEEARKQKIAVDEERVVVTGPPVDPRIVKARNKKSKNPNSSLRLAITTGGLGQNHDEILQAIESLAEKVKTGKIQLVLYASTLIDFREMYENYAKKHSIPLAADIDDDSAPLRVIYSSSIVDANQALVDHVFPWADGFLTKPSGDMAYDAAASGSFILSLSPWGVWEENILKTFSDLSILKEANPKRFSEQIDELEKTGWISKAQESVHSIDKLFLSGAKKIIDLQRKLAKNNP